MLKNAVILLGLTLWPLALFLANTPGDFIRYALPVVLLGVSFILFKRQNEWYLLPVLATPFVEPKLALLALSIAALDLAWTKKKTAVFLLLLSSVSLMLVWKSFAGQTIFTPDYETRQEVIGKTYLAIPAYHSQRLVTPAMMLLFFLRFRKELLLPPLRRYLLMGAVIGLIISLPTLSVATTPGFLARAAGLNIFSQARQQPAGFIEGYHGTLHWLVNGSWFLTTREFASLYVSYFSPRNMFVLGDSGPRSSFPELSTFFIWQFPFYLYGLYILVKKKNLGELRFITLALLLVAPLPAAVTRDPYSTIRAENMVIPQLIIIALGMLAAFSTFKVKSNLNNLKGWVGIGILLLLVIYSVGKLYSSVFILNEHFRAKYWNYGWEEVAKIIKNEFDPNLSIIVDNARGEPYSQLLFFLKFDPQTYQEENFEVPRSEYYTNMNRNTTKKIGNITTRPINWEKDLLVEQYLVGDELSISKEQIKRHNLDLISEITYPDKSVAFRLIKTNP